ncbi:MAG: hypothetical protein IPL35_14070 [Sphingobacteriales bacterium]|nr:hypothetical protein [Sphingobacteriales bacterium]
MYKLTLPFYTEGTPDTLAVGDTLWFNADFSDTLPDVINIGEKWHMHDFDFRSSFRIFRLDKDTVKDAARNFDIAVIKGTVSPFYYSTGSISNDFEAEFSPDTHHYAVRFGVVPQEQGTYHLFFGSFILPISDRYNIDPCCRGKETVFFTIAPIIMQIIIAIYFYLRLILYIHIALIISRVRITGNRGLIVLQ